VSGLSACPTQRRSYSCSRTVLPFAAVVHRARSGQSQQAAPKTTSQNLLISRLTPARQVTAPARLVDGEVVEGVAAEHRRPQRQRLDQRLVAGRLRPLFASGHRSHHNSRLVATVDENAGVRTNR
jgi:hypothetical protein